MICSFVYIHRGACAHASRGQALLGFCVAILWSSHPDVHLLSCCHPRHRASLVFWSCIRAYWLYSPLSYTPKDCICYTIYAFLMHPADQQATPIVAWGHTYSWRFTDVYWIVLDQCGVVLNLCTHPRKSAGSSTKWSQVERFLGYPRWSHPSWWVVHFRTNFSTVIGH